MIEPGTDDIGRTVIYMPGVAENDPTHPACETGYITGYNLHYVFVRYGDDPQSKATMRRDLIFAQRIKRGDV